MNLHGVEMDGAESGHVSRVDLSSPRRAASARDARQAGFPCCSRQCLPKERWAPESAMGQLGMHRLVPHHRGGY